MSVIGRPPEDPVDREEEVGKIVGAMTDPKTNANYALVGHRRIGKSTILAKVKRILDENNQVIIGYVDLGEFRHSPVEFAETLTESLTESYSKTLPRTSKVIQSITSAISQIKEIKRLRARFTASVDVMGNPKIEIDPLVKSRTKDHAKSLFNVFDYANELSQISKKRVLVIIDEFQHIIDYRKMEGLERIHDILKTIIEKRTNVSFVVSGSRVHYLQNILGGGTSPLFGHFVILDIEPLEKKYAIELFAKSSRDPASRETAEAAFEEVGGHPYYLVMLAEGRKKDELVHDAYMRLLTRPTGAIYLYVNYVLTENLGASYKSTNYPPILVSLAMGAKPVSEIARDAQIRMTDLPRLLNTLIEYDIIGKSGKKYFIADKVVRDFFCQAGA